MEWVIKLALWRTLCLKLQKLGTGLKILKVFWEYIKCVLPSLTEVVGFVN